MSNVIIIPARGGSKGIPLKNIYPLKGKPLLEYTLDSIIEIRSDLVFDTVVSTDSDEIAKIARKYDKVYIIKRPDDLSRDTSLTEDALLHALDYMHSNYNKKYENIITLQPTSPLRKPNTIKQFIMEFIENSAMYDAQLSLTESRSDYWIKTSEDKFERLFKNSPRRRQDRKPIYIENSAIYITKVEALRRTGSILGSKVKGYLINDIEGIDINEISDIKLAESYL